MTKPVRLQLSRRKGFRLQEHSRAVNGLPAVNCARPNRWGNRYKVGVDGSAFECVSYYRHDLATIIGAPLTGEGLRKELELLRGRNLACWCALDAWCHVDVLLDLANRPNARAA